MKVTDFLELAERLSKTHSEAELRSAVSRAYYGAFHAARLKLEACGVILPESAEAHKKACFCLDVIAHNVSAALDSLRRKRNEADYCLSNIKFRDETFVALQISTARNCVDSIKSLETKVIREPIRAYARDVLKYDLAD
jgi:hypothetical protein